MQGALDGGEILTECTGAYLLLVSFEAVSAPPLAFELRNFALCLDRCQSQSEPSRAKGDVLDGVHIEEVIVLFCGWERLCVGDRASWDNLEVGHGLGKLGKLTTYILWSRSIAPCDSPVISADGQERDSQQGGRESCFGRPFHQTGYVIEIAELLGVPLTRE